MQPDAPRKLIPTEELLYELERLSNEAKALIPHVRRLEDKQKLLDDSLHLHYGIRAVRRVKDTLGEA